MLKVRTQNRHKARMNSCIALRTNTGLAERKSTKLQKCNRTATSVKSKLAKLFISIQAVIERWLGCSDLVPA
jgi:hypothetical protein